MSLLKHLDRVALASMLFVSIGVVAAQVFTESGFSNIQPGMSAEEVQARLGPPPHKSRFDRTRTTTWDYKGNDAWSYDSEFSVVFNDSNVVVSKIVVRLGQ